MTQAAKVAIVTGANRGIGFEVVHQLARQGIQVVLGARDQAKGEVAAQSLTQGEHIVNKGSAKRERRRI